MRPVSAETIKDLIERKFEVTKIEAGEPCQILVHRRPSSGEIIELEDAREDRRHFRVEYDLNYHGGDYSNVGQFVHLNCWALAQIGGDRDEAVKTLFKQVTGHDPVHIINYNLDELYDAKGESHD